jgi:SAM-dependent methyltransferase
LDDSERPCARSAADYLDYDYDRFYASTDFDYNEKVESAFVEALLQGLLRLPRGSSVIDLGCGTGFDTWLMDRIGYRAIGVDVSRVAIEKAQQRPSKARFIQADVLTARPLLEEAFDVAYCSGFMAFNWVESLHDPAAVQTGRVLLQYVRPGGRLLFIWDSILTGKRWSPYPDLEPDRMFMNYTVDQVRELWQCTGGCRIRWAGVSHKRLAPLLGRRAFCRPVSSLLTPLARRLRRPVQILVIVERVADSCG